MERELNTTKYLQLVAAFAAACREIELNFLDPYQSARRELEAADDEQAEWQVHENLLKMIFRKHLEKIISEVDGCMEQHARSEYGHLFEALKSAWSAFRSACAKEGLFHLPIVSEERRNREPLLTAARHYRMKVETATGCRVAMVTTSANQSINDLVRCQLLSRLLNDAIQRGSLSSSFYPQAGKWYKLVKAVPPKAPANNYRAWRAKVVEVDGTGQETPCDRLFHLMDFECFQGFMAQSCKVFEVATM